MPKLCDKCGNYDATPLLADDSRCPACGVVYAKLQQSLATAAPTRLTEGATGIAEP